jgi:hypothetical protein
MATTNVTLHVEGMPEVLATMRSALADVLRELAQDESPATAARLRAAADRFETGVSEED